MTSWTSRYVTNITNIGSAYGHYTGRNLLRCRVAIRKPAAEPIPE